MKILTVFVYILLLSQTYMFTFFCMSCEKSTLEKNSFEEHINSAMFSFGVCNLKQAENKRNG